VWSVGRVSSWGRCFVEFDIEEAIRQLATESILKDASTPVDCPALEILLNGLKDILIVVMYQSFSDTKKISLNAIAKEGGN